MNPTNPTNPTYPPNTKPAVIVICGPTGIGKTSAAIATAERYNAEIIGADSMQIYRQLDMGTAKPTPAEQSRIPHHMINVAEPDEPFDASQYLHLAREIVSNLHDRGVVPLVVGGTGLYIKALLYGLFEAEKPDERIRQLLKAEAESVGCEEMHRRLSRIDPEAAGRIHPHDTLRIIRALETYEQTGQTLSEYHRKHGFPDSPYSVLKIGLNIEREELYKRINQRVNLMIAENLVEEVKGLMDRGYSEDLKSMQSLGYRHMVDYLRGRLDWEEAVRTMKRDTRRYAKRQLTWLRADPQIVWTTPDRIEELYPNIDSFLAQNK
jgi:tRNA dimethylallyltransferase